VNSTLDMYHENSGIAWEAIRESLGQSQERVYKAILGHPGITRQNISSSIGLPINSVSGRVNDLIKLGLVYEDGNEYFTDACTGRTTQRARLYAEIEPSISNDTSKEGDE